MEIMKNSEGFGSKTKTNFLYLQKKKRTVEISLNGSFIFGFPSIILLAISMPNYNR